MSVSYYSTFNSCLLSKVIQIIGAKPLVNVRTFHTHVEENCTIIFSMCPKKGQEKHGRIWSSVPKGKRMLKKNFKEVSQVCPNKKKGAKKSLKEVLLNLPKKQSQKKGPKEVKKKSL